MSSRPLPRGWKLARGVDYVVLTDDYQHWTVADVIEILREYNPDARVWVQVGKNGLSPLETMEEHEGELIL